MAAIIFVLSVTVWLLCCLRMASLADRHDEILHDSENEKY